MRKHLKRSRSAGLGFAMLAAVVALMVVARVGAAPSAPNDFPQRVVNRTNMYRQQNGCAALSVSSKLKQAAQGHSDDMAYNDFFGHVGSDGATFAQRLKRAGYQFISAGENIAAGYQTPEDVVDAWFNETPPNDGHRRNILNCDFQDIGVGYTYLANDTGEVNYNHYWVQDFGQPKPSPMPTMPPAPTETPVPCDTAPDAPILVAPTANALVPAPQTVLDWKNVTCANAYRVIVKRGAADGKVVDKKNGLTVSKYKTVALTSGKTYFWRAAACNSIGCTWSEWRSFRMQ